MLNISKDKSFLKLAGLAVLAVFLISALSLGSQVANVPEEITPIETAPVKPVTTTAPAEESKAVTQTDLSNILDNHLMGWRETGSFAEDVKTSKDGNPAITVFTAEPLNYEVINSAMNIESYLDLGGYYIIMGNVESVSQLEKLTTAAPMMKVEASPLFAPEEVDVLSPEELEVVVSPEQDTYGVYGQDETFVGDAYGGGYMGQGVTISVVDGGIDFGNSALEPNLALDSNGLPKNFDSEGWSLIATPLEVGTDIPISTDNTTIEFSEGNMTAIMEDLHVNDNFGIQAFDFWNGGYGFTAPRDFTIDPNWVGLTGDQAAPKFGVGWQDWPYGEADHSWAYLYALVIDVDGDGVYDSAVIDMQSSAWVNWHFYEHVYAEGALPNPAFEIPEWDFSNDKVVSWLPGANTGADFTFTADWNSDGINDWSHGSMATAYNRYGYLTTDDSYGKIVEGVDPDGAGFVALYPNAAAFGSHGTWCGSMAASSDLTSIYGLHGAAPAADLMSVSWGASPQDAILAWLWSAGMDLETAEPEIAALEGSMWTYSGDVRAHITSNSWGSLRTNSGFEGYDWIMDLMSSPNMGGTEYVHRDVWEAYVNASGGTWDVTGEAFLGNLTVFNTTAAVGDIIYLGSIRPAVGYAFYVNDVGTGGAVGVEYWDGDSWEALTHTGDVDFLSMGYQSDMWTLPTGWEPSNYTNGGSELYWIRYKVTTAFTNFANVSYIRAIHDNQFWGYPGMLMVTSAGNDGYYTSNGAAYGTLSLKVGSSKSSHYFTSAYGADWAFNLVADHTSAGPKSIGSPNVDVLAPGWQAYSWAPLYSSGLASNGLGAYTAWSGTSASSPWAAGVAALAYQAWIAENPGEIPEPSYIKNVLTSTATSLGHDANVEGSGLLNATAAVMFINGTGDDFIMGANDTYENMYWGVTRHRAFFGWPYFYGWDYSSDPLTGDIDWPNPNDGYAGLEHNTLLDQYHYANDLFTGVITEGDTYETQVMVEGNSSDVTVDAVSLGTPLVGTHTFDLETDSDVIADGFGAFRAAIDPTEAWNFTANQWDYLEIYIHGDDYGKTYYTDLFSWIDDGDGEIFMRSGTNGGELAHIQRAYSGNYGMIKMGAGVQITDDGVPLLVVRPDDVVDRQDPLWVKGLSIDVTIRAYNYTTDSMFTIDDAGDGLFDVEIDTTGASPAVHTGYLAFTMGGHVQYMPYYVKVAANIDAGTGTTPTDVATVELNQYGLENANGAMADGDWIWLYFQINETKHTQDQYLVTKISGDVDHLGAFMGWDEIPKYRGGQEIWSHSGLTGEDVLWYYQSWEEPNWYAYEVGPGGIFTYHLGVYSTDLAQPFNDVTVEMYWLDTLPSSVNKFYDADGNDISSGGLIQGPNYEINATGMVVNADPQWASGDAQILFGALEAKTIVTTGEYENGVIGDTSVDWWETREFMAGDLVEWSAGADDGADDSDVFIYFPSTAASLGLPTAVPGDLPGGYDLSAGTAAAVESGSFVAPETGTYFFALDNWDGGASGWILTTKFSRGELKPMGNLTLTVDTMTNPAFGENVESVYDPATGTWDVTNAVSVGMHTPTNLDANLTTAAFYFDNWVHPEVNFTQDTWEDDRLVLERGDIEFEFSWTGDDANDDDLLYIVTLSSPRRPTGPPAAFYHIETTQTSYTWKFSEDSIFPDGTWTVRVQAYDQTDLGGYSDPVSIVVSIESPPQVTTVTEKITSVVTTTITESASTSTSSPGFLLGIALLGMLAVVPIVRRRRK